MQQKKDSRRMLGCRGKPTLDCSRRILGFSRKKKNKTERTVSAPVELVIGKRVSEH